MGGYTANIYQYTGTLNINTIFLNATSFFQFPTSLCSFQNCKIINPITEVLLSNGFSFSYSGIGDQTQFYIQMPTLTLVSNL